MNIVLQSIILQSIMLCYLILSYIGYCTHTVTVHNRATITGLIYIYIPLMNFAKVLRVGAVSKSYTI